MDSVAPRRTARHGRLSWSPWRPDRQPEGACTRCVERLGPSWAGSWSPAARLRKIPSAESDVIGPDGGQRAAGELRRFLIAGEDLGVRRSADDSGRTAGIRDAARTIDEDEDREGNPAMPATASDKSRSHTTHDGLSTMQPWPARMVPACPTYPAARIWDSQSVEASSPQRCGNLQLAHASQAPADDATARPRPIHAPQSGGA